MTSPKLTGLRPAEIPRHMLLPGAFQQVCMVRLELCACCLVLHAPPRKKDKEAVLPWEKEGGNSTLAGVVQQYPIINLLHVDNVWSSLNDLWNCRVAQVDDVEQHVWVKAGRKPCGMTCHQLQKMYLCCATVTIEL